MRTLLIISTMLTLVQCKSATSTEFTTDELLIGTWTVSSATIDGVLYPVTNPGLLQVQAIFTENSFQYIYPQTTNGLPNGNTDTLSGTWALNEDETMINITPTGATEAVLVWTIDRLAVGTLEVTFLQQSLSGVGTSTYHLIYSLVSE